MPLKQMNKVDDSPTIVAKMMSASTTDVTAMRTSEVMSVSVALPLAPRVLLQPHDTASAQEQLPLYQSDVEYVTSSRKNQYT